MASPGDITALLRRARDGDRTAESSLYDLVYLQLRNRAHLMLHGDRLAPALSSGTIVHESFEKLFRGGSVLECQDRAHFYFVAARAMRQVIIEHARKRAASVRGGDLIQVPLDIVGAQGSGGMNIEQVIAVGEICDRLAVKSPRAAEVIELRFFGGLTVDETAEVLNVSKTTVDERLSYAKAVLRRELTRSSGAGHAG